MTLEIAVESNQKLLDLLQADLQNTERLAQLLTAERTQLEQRQFAELPQLLRQKADLLASLERNAQARQEALRRHGCDNDAQGMLAHCEALDAQSASSRHRDSFQQLQRQLAQCQEMNLVNAAIVHRSKLNTGKLLNILKGRQPAAGLYTALGAADDGDGASRTLGSA